MNTTTPRLLRVDFAAGEGVQRPGFDGVVLAEQGSKYVPAGRSVWELGCSQNVKKKANEDYQKRTADLDAGIDPKRTTYIFVTPRSWIERDEWAAERRKEQVWLDVQAYDADSLEQWLEQSPAASAWLGAVLGRPSEAGDLDTFWAEWSQRTRPVTSPSLVLAGREGAVQSMNRWLSGAPSALSTSLADPEEAAAFLFAAAQQLPVVDRDRLTDRVIIVRKDDVLRSLDLDGRALVIVALECDLGAARQAAKRGHHVLVATREKVKGDRLDLGLIDRPRANAALEAMGLDPELAKRYAMSFHGELAELRGLLDYQRLQLAPELAPLLLAGSWVEGNANDECALLALTGLAQPDLEAMLQRNIVGSTAPLRRLETVWSWRSRLDAWRRGAEALTATNMNRFKQAALTVLGEVDPRFELPEEDRWAAAIHGRVLRHSEALREGIAEGIAYLGVEGGALDKGAIDGVRAAEELVYLLLTGATTWEAWASLDRLLPVLAEAAPKTFLRAVRSLIEGRPEITAELFPVNAERNAQADHSVGLIWALETLAWHQDYLGEVADLLLLVAERGWSRAMEVARQIFLHWIPHTTASVERRVEVLKACSRRHPEVGFELLVSLLPHTHDTSMSTARPKYRLWLEGWDDQPTGEDAHGILIAVSDLVVAAVGAGPDRLMKLLPHLHQLSEDVHRPQVVEALARLDVTQIQEETRRELWKALRSELHTQLTYKDAEWTLKDEAHIQVLRHLYDRLEPQDLEARYAWLFASVARLPEGFGDDWEAQEQALTEARQAAALHLAAERGAAGLVAFAAAVEEPGFLAVTLGRSANQDLLRAVLALLPENPVSGIPNFRPNLTHGLRQRQDGIGLTQVGIDSLPLLVRADLAIGLPFQAETWDMVESWGPEATSHYWRYTPTWLFEAARDLHRALDRLLAAGRIYEAFDLAARHSRPMQGAPPLLQVEDAALVLGAEQVVHVDAYKIGELFTVLAQGDLDSDEQRFRLEWRWLSHIEHSRYTPQALFRQLAKDPELFVTVLSWVFRADGEEPHDLTREEEARGANAYRLLRIWNRLPGQEDGGQLDADELRRWVEEARRLATLCGRAAVGDIQIGKVLARAPVGTDRIWPHEAVRELLETLQGTEHLESGFLTGFTNNRGVTSRAVGAGGDQERSSARRFREQAATLQGRWPTTARFLETIAEDHERHAKFWDSRGAQDRDKHVYAASTADRLAVWVDEQYISGHFAFSLEDASHAMDRSESEVQQAVVKLLDHKRIICLDAKFCVIVPDIYEGSPPPSWYIHHWMAWANQPYRVGLLSAAALYGAAPQQPQEFQVLVDKPRELVTVGRSPIRFIVTDIPARVREIKTDTGIMRVSAPEETALDLVQHAHYAGGIDAVANVLVELGESLDPDQLAVVARAYPSAVVQRLGWLLERVDHTAAADALRPVVQEKANGLVWLRTDAAVDEDQPKIVKTWRVAIERDVELDT